MTNELFVALQLFTSVLAKTNGVLIPHAPCPEYRVFALRPVYGLAYTNRCGYCTAVEERNRNGWLVHIEGSCTCRPRKVFSHYELVPADGKEILP